MRVPCMVHRGKEAPWTGLEPGASPGAAMAFPGLAPWSDLGAAFASGQTGGAHTLKHAACWRELERRPSRTRSFCRDWPVGRRVIPLQPCSRI